MRLTLASMFIATTLVAVAAWAARGVVVCPKPVDRLYCLMAIPFLICAAVGSLFGRLGFWKRYGLVAAVVILELILFGSMMK
jgi:hypothetical protein